MSGGRGRPYPDMILTCVLRLGIDDVRAVAVAGDTESDIRSGLAAGASIVAGVLTGAHDRDRLLAAGATHVLDSVAELVDSASTTTAHSTQSAPIDQLAERHRETNRKGRERRGRRDRDSR